MISSFFKKNEAEIMDRAEVISKALNFMMLFKPLDEVMEFAYNSVDEIFKESGYFKDTSCQKGCSFCCHDSIIVSKMEAEYLKRKLTGVSFDSLLLKRQNKTEFSNLKWKHKRCVLLDKNNRCSIYENRPLICRTHNSLDAPELCHLGNNDKGHKQAYSIEIEATAIALMMCSGGEHIEIHNLLNQIK